MALEVRAQSLMKLVSVAAPGSVIFSVLRVPRKWGVETRRLGALTCQSPRLAAGHSWALVLAVRYRTEDPANCRHMRVSPMLTVVTELFVQARQSYAFSQLLETTRLLGHGADIVWPSLSPARLERRGTVTCPQATAPVG